MDDKQNQESISYIEGNFKILTKANESGLSDLIPMKLNPVQKFYAENRTKRDVILKARQMGISTGIMALNASTVFTTPYQKMIIVAHNDEIAQILFQTIQRFYRNLPEKTRPKTDWRSGTRMRFPKEDCFIHVGSAESKALGFGESLNIVHISEMSRWPQYKVEDLFAGLSQAVPLNGYLVIESTPRGRGGKFYEIYNGAKKKENNYAYYFFPWWFDLQYKIPVKGKLNLTEDESSLMRCFGLTEEQIAFRREKIIDLSDLFYQEYPENDTDCWLSSEVGVFDAIEFRKYQEGLYPGKKDGNATIWKDAIGGHQYVIGVDCAGGLPRGDFSVAAVLDTRKNEYVARVRGRIPPDMFAEEVLRLGKRYNWAQIGVERQMHGHTVIKILMDNNYPNIYHSHRYDVYSQETVGQPGWNTDAKTKPQMIDTLKAALRAGDIIIYSENFINEASAIVWEGTKVKKPKGSYDDEVDAVMIALQLREAAPTSDFTGNENKIRSYARF